MKKNNIYTYTIINNRLVKGVMSDRAYIALAGMKYNRTYN